MRNLFVILLLFIASTARAESFDKTRLVKNAIRVCTELHKEESPDFYSCVSKKSLEYYAALGLRDDALYEKLTQFAFTIHEMDNDYKRDALNAAQMRWIAGLYLMNLIDDLK